MPENPALLANFPNPFDNSTIIKFPMPTPGNVSISSYDLSGRKVDYARLDALAAETHEFIWDSAGLPSGVYYYRADFGNLSLVRKLALIK